MTLRNAVCSIILGAFVYGLSWLLGLLSKAMPFGFFMIFGVVTIAIMISSGYAYDQFERRKQG